MHFQKKKKAKYRLQRQKPITLLLLDPFFTYLSEPLKKIDGSFFNRGGRGKNFFRKNVTTAKMIFQSLTCPKISTNIFLNARTQPFAKTKTYSFMVFDNTAFNNNFRHLLPSLLFPSVSVCHLPLIYQV
nr:MAG TPA: hypothetical protein [Caudoviricetes sp.]